MNSAELDEAGNNFASPAARKEPTTEPAERKKLSEWRRLEKQIIRGDLSDGSSPPKQRLRAIEELKGDRAVPDSGVNLGQDS